MEEKKYMKMNRPIVTLFICLLLITISFSSFLAEDVYADYVTGPYSKTWYPSGSNVTRKLAARLQYSITNSDTTYKISCSGQETVYKDNLGLTVNGKLTFAGSTTTGSKKYTFESDGSKPNTTGVFYTICSAITKSWTKGCTTQSTSASMYAYKSSDTSINSTASKTFTIPALTRYAITYDANGGSGAPDTNTGTNGCDTSDGKVYGKEFTLPTTIPTRAGYTFKGWNTENDGTGTNYSAGGTYTDNTAVTLYANWLRNTQILHYDKNGGTGTDITDQIINNNESFTIKTNSYSKIGYRFMGWKVSLNNNVIWYRNYNSSDSFSNSYPAGSDITLSAQWCKKSDATITVNSQELAKDDYGNYVFKN